MNLSPLARRALMKTLPKALNAKSRDDFLRIIYDELEENNYFKKDILNFFLKSKGINASIDEEAEEMNLPSVVLNYHEIIEIKKTGLLSELRRYELEIFGIGEDFIEANDEGIDTINLYRINTLFELIVAHNLMSDLIPTEEEKEITSLENESFFIPMRMMWKEKPCTLIICDSKFFLIEKLIEIGNDHLSRIMPHRVEDKYHLDENDDIITNTHIIFEKEEHSKKIYYDMVYNMVSIINEMVENNQNIIPEDFLYTETLFKSNIDIYSKIIMIKNIEISKKIDLKKLTSTLERDFKKYPSEYFDNIIPILSEELMDSLDEKIANIELKLTREKELREKGVALISDKIDNSNIIFQSSIDFELD